MRPFLYLLGRVLALSLLSRPSLAQQPTPTPNPPPVMNSTPQPGTAAPGTPVLGEIIGQTYNVELVSGTAFLGVLTASSPAELRFQTRDLGLLVLPRANLKQLTGLTPAQARRGYDYQGNGSRLFFAPTARNLRRGEGAAQTIDLFLLGVNYGLTDNISVGALFSWVPGAGADNLFALTPKVSFLVRENLHVGAGGLVFYQGGDFYTLAYANTTYGSADHNLTAGVGYALVPGEAVSTPVFLLGGVRRISRRVSLANESYFLRISGGDSEGTFVGGIAGVRVAGPRLSGSLGLMYGYAEASFSSGNTLISGGGAVPFAEATYRFGRVR